MTKRRLITLVSGVAVLALASWWRLQDEGPTPPSPDEPPPRMLARGGDRASAVPSFSGKTMGTTYTVKYIPPHDGMHDVASVAVQVALDDVVRSMSTYEKESEISLLNRAPANQKINLSDDLAQVLVTAEQVHKKTNGAFDITVGPLVEAFGFGTSVSSSAPAETILAQLRPIVGMNLVKLDSTAAQITKLNDGVRLDLGGIAKGFGVDQAARALRKLGIKRFMVEVGGEILVSGHKNKDQPWTLAIEEPIKAGRKIHGTLQLPKEGGALATSGDYRNFREIDGNIVSHTFDPRSKRPVPRRTASVSVIRPTATEADALATAFTVLEPAEAIRIANQHDFAVYILTHKEGGGFAPYSSDAFRRLDFEQRRTPP